MDKIKTNFQSCLLAEEEPVHASAPDSTPSLAAGRISTALLSSTPGIDELNWLQKLLQIQSVLQQLQLEKIRMDFLAGQIISIANSKGVLLSMDAILNLLWPEWVPNWSKRKLLTMEAATHLRKLMVFSPEYFLLPSPVFGCLCEQSYATWMVVLENLLASNYWNAVDVGSSVEQSENSKSCVFLKKNLSNPVLTCRNACYSKGNIISSSLVHGHSEASDIPSVRGCKYSSSSSSVSENEDQALKVPQNFHQIEITDSSEDSRSSNFSSDISCEEVDNSKYCVVREVVTPSCFELNDKQSLKMFLGRYEHYFKTKFRGTQRECTQELVKFICGEVREAYEALGGSRLKYPDMKVALLHWYAARSRGKVRQFRLELANACMKPEESFTIYCMRIQEIAKRAFPHNHKKYCKQLKHHLKITVSDQFQSALEEKEELKAMTGRGKKLTWAEMIEIAEQFDVKQRRNDVSKRRANSDKDVAVLKTPDKARDRYNIGDSTNCFLGAASVKRVPGAAANLPLCHYCGRKGHRELNCWLRHGLCTICGSHGHQFKECPNYVISKCSLCFGPHFGKDCSHLR